MSPHYFTTAQLRALADDLALIGQAIAAGHAASAAPIAAALADSVLGRLTEAEGPKYSTFGQNKALACLTGWAMYPPRHWQALELSVTEASDAIDDLKLEGEALIGNVTYRRTERSKSKCRAA